MSKQRQYAIEECLDRMVEWYVTASGGKFPEQCCHDDQRSLWWLDPPLPAMTNYVLRAVDLDGKWALEFIERKDTIRSVGGL